MECLIKDKNNKKIIIWTLDGSPKFYQVEFKQFDITSNCSLKIIWNRPIKDITTNALTIKICHSDVFFEEKTISVNQFMIESQEILDALFRDVNNKLILQGLTIEKSNNIVNKKINKYVNKIIKYIKKKNVKKEDINKI